MAQPVHVFVRSLRAKERACLRKYQEVWTPRYGSVRTTSGRTRHSPVEGARSDTGKGWRMASLARTQPRGSPPSQRNARG